jgi:serine/threonine-protein kinase RsbW
MINQIENLNITSVYTLQLPSNTNSIALVENFIDELSVKFGFSDLLYANVLTCLSEAVVNGIIHGNRQRPDKKVYINLEVIEEKQFIFTISDEGEGFNLNSLPDTRATENLTGRGVFLINKLADQCIFNSKGNELELHFKI